MKPTNLIAIFGTLIILGIIYLIFKANQREKIKQAAINSGIPADIAASASRSTDPARALRSLGVPTDVATLIGLGTSVQQIKEDKDLYKCTWTDPKSGAVTTKDGPCTEVDANNNWVTSSK